MEHTPDTSERFDQQTTRRHLDAWLGGTSVMASLDSEWGPRQYHERAERARQEAQGQATGPEYREFPDSEED